MYDNDGKIASNQSAHAIATKQMLYTVEQTIEPKKKNEKKNHEWMIRVEKERKKDAHIHSSWLLKLSNYFFCVGGEDWDGIRGRRSRRRGGALCLFLVEFLFLSFLSLFISSCILYYFFYSILARYALIHNELNNSLSVRKTPGFFPCVHRGGVKTCTPELWRASGLITVQELHFGEMRGH